MNLTDLFELNQKVNAIQDFLDLTGKLSPELINMLNDIKEDIHQMRSIESLIQC